MTDPCTAGLASLAQYLWTQIWAKRHRQHSMSYKKVGQSRPNVQFKPSSPISRCRVHIMSKPGFSASFFSPRMSELNRSWATWLHITLRRSEAAILKTNISLVPKDVCTKSYRTSSPLRVPWSTDLTLRTTINMIKLNQPTSSTESVQPGSIQLQSNQVMFPRQTRLVNGPDYIKFSHFRQAPRTRIEGQHWGDDYKTKLSATGGLN